MSVSNDVDAPAASELRQRQPQRPADSQQETPLSASDPELTPVGQDDAKGASKKTYGRTPNGTGKWSSLSPCQRPFAIIG